MKRLLSLWLLLLAIMATLAPSLRAQESGWGMHKRMFAVPAPKNVVIDGRLDDWDLSGSIEMYVMAATKEMQGARFAVMYDADALYLGGIVRSTTGMINRHSPEAEGDNGWDANACQFRIEMDPKAGYPVKNYTWDPHPDDQLVHLTLWCYSDRNEANLQASRSMRYQPMPGGNKFGVLPHDSYQGVFRLADDKRGYTFEYRIPWVTLGAKNPQKGGDMVAATMQINWSRPDGLRNEGSNGWGYDLLAFPGVAYQNAESSGKLIFSKEGHLPKSVVEDGVPPQKPLPLTFSYHLPEADEVTIALYNAQNEVVRALTTQAMRPAGQVTEQWDGLDELGRPLPAGQYSWKGLYHKPLSTKHVLSVHNSGQPPWRKDDNTGGWGGDHGNPSAICVAGDGLALGWTSSEVGHGLIRTNSEGKKQWGVLALIDYLASDGERIYSTGPIYGTLGSDTLHGRVACNALKDGQVLSFGNGSATLQAPPGGDGKTDVITGLACAGGKVYVSFKPRDLIAVYDGKQGTLLKSWPVPQPGSLAATPDGTLVCVTGRAASTVADSEGWYPTANFSGADSGTGVVAVKDGVVTPLISSHLDAPTGIAVDADGKIYVANQGKLQNVSVFSPNGKYLRGIGKPGGRPLVGRYNPAGMLCPAGLAVDSKGRLWVAEQIDSPKRVSVWDSKTGKPVKEFFGPAHYSSFIWMDPERPDEVYCDGVLWKIDLNKKTSYPYSTYWRAKGINSPGTVDNYNFGLRVFTAKNGRQYGWAMDSSYCDEILFQREGDLFQPILALYWGGNVPVISKKFPQGGITVWQDKNNDQMWQADEVGPQLSDQVYDLRGMFWVDKELNLWLSHADARVYRPLRIEKDGRPVYDFTKRVAYTVPGTMLFSRQVGADGEDHSLYLLQCEDPPGNNLGFARFTPEGKMCWGYRGSINWSSGGFGLPPQQPGKLWGPIAWLGTAGDYTGFGTYFGCQHIFTREEGLCVGMLFRDPRLGGGLGSDVIFCENGNGQLVKPRGMNRYFALGGDQDGRISEIFGLDTVKRLPGGTLTLSAEDVRTVLAAQAEYQAKKSKAQKLVIGRGGRLGLDSVQPVAKLIDANESFEVKATYDDKNLYLSYKITSPSELMTGATDAKRLFKGGNCLDIQLAADPQADSKRKIPAPGDLRILVSRKDGKPYAVIYRPKVNGFNGPPAWTFTTSTNQESFDSIEQTAKIGLEYQKSIGLNAFTALVTVPLELLGWTPRPCTTVKMDVGYIFGNATGTQATARSYWTNNGFDANILIDDPTESRLTPHEWGVAEVE